MFADFDFTNNNYLYYNAQVLSYAQDERFRKVINIIIPNELKTGCNSYQYYVLCLVDIVLEFGKTDVINKTI
jgi:hypothetical protein